MIVSMSKVEIAGPRELLKDTLSLIQDTGKLHIEPSAVGFIEKKDEKFLESFIPDRGTLTERLFLEDLRARLEELLSYLSSVTVKKSCIEPLTILDTVNGTLQKHLAFCREKRQREESLRSELSDLGRYRFFLDAIEPLLRKVKDTTDLDFIGLTLKDARAKSLLREILTIHAEGKFELLTSAAPDGTIVGLIAVSRRISDGIKGALNDKNIPELKFPPSFGALTFVEKMHFLKGKIIEMEAELEEIGMQMDSFSTKWGAIYKRVKEWLDERLSLLGATALVFETNMCFFIYGWMATEDVGALKKKLNMDFGGKVVLDEMEIMEEDIDRMPVILKNPPYFKPFELFTMILPLPLYTSFDPTPFIGIFFPVFFGMILGDAGYGLLLIPLSLFILRRYRGKQDIADAAKILFISSVYVVFFGVLYGEFFGELGHKWFGVYPLLVERRTAVMPMLYFAVTVGVVHILLGNFLGFTAAFRRKTKKEALCRLFNIMIILCVLVLVASMFGLFPSVLARPAILAILFLSPLLLFTGGLLAPLELLKSIGNIISYARIMAIGLTSVLLAFVANRLAGMTGDIAVGIVVAGLLHLLNIVIGVFSPTIHSLRLHYVEFFSKFIETGGRRFEPLKKGHKI